MTYTLTAQSLCKTYGKRNVVNHINLKISTDEIVGILGPNGAGKTTTFYMIVGLITPDSGKIFLKDQELTRLPMHQRARLGIGYLPQESSVFRKLSVYDNLLVIAEFLDIPRNRLDSTITQALDDLGIAHLAQQKAYTLSGGERRRLEIARILITKPKFLLLDEPFSGIDPISIDEIQRIIVGLKTRHIGVLITDHNVRETLSIVDRAYLIYEGKVLCEGNKNELLSDPRSRALYLGERFSM